jgi:hypothetical protein
MKHTHGRAIQDRAGKKLSSPAGRTLVQARRRAACKPMDGVVDEQMCRIAESRFLTGDRGVGSCQTTQKSRGRKQDASDFVSPN